MSPDVFSLISTALGSGVLLLLGAMLWFIRREIQQNDRAHDRLNDKVDCLQSDVTNVRVDVAKILGILSKPGTAS